MDCELRQWLPYELKLADGEWTMMWIFVGDYHFNEPFFDETINQLKIIKGGSRFLSSTSLATFANLVPPLKVLPITSFIFHVSRCGSTLLSQALAVDQNNIVIPEAPLFDQILRMKEHDDISNTIIEEIFIKAVNWYGQNRSGNYQQYHIKLDSWHVHFYDQLRNMFAGVPFYFLTRAPLAIIKSHIKRRGIHTIPGYINSALLGVALGDKHFQDFNYYTEEVLANFYAANLSVLQQEHRLNYFFDYGFGVQEMTLDFYDKILKINTVPSPVIARLEKSSKEPQLTFNGDDHASKYQIRYAKVLNAYQQLLEKIMLKRWP